MLLFEQVWCETQPTDAELLRHWIAALSAAGLVSDRLEAAVASDSVEALRRIIAKRKVARHPEAEAAIRAQLARLEGLMAS